MLVVHAPYRVCPLGAHVDHQVGTTVLNLIIATTQPLEYGLLIYSTFSESMSLRELQNWARAEKLERQSKGFMKGVINHKRYGVLLATEGVNRAAPQTLRQQKQQR